MSDDFAQFRPSRFNPPPAQHRQLATHPVHSAATGGPAYTPEPAADVMLQARLMRAFKAGFISLEDVITALSQKNLPPRVRQVPFPFLLTDTQPHILIPQSLDRMAFIVANPDPGAPNIIMSFDMPLVTDNSGASAAFFGVPIAASSFYQESNGTVSVNDIYVQLTDATNPVWVIGYEGHLALETSSLK